LPSVWLSDAEKEWAKKEVEQVRKRLGKKFIVLWNIFGSCFHKMYPHMFDVFFLIKTNRDDIEYWPYRQLGAIRRRAGI